MNALAMSLLLFVLQSQTPNPAAPLVGTWSVSAPAPLPPRTAPFGPQSFTIALEGGKVMVTMGREAAVEAAVYVAPRPYFTEQVALTVTQTRNGATFVYLIRATGGARADVDLLITPADSTRTGGTYGPLGTFTKAK